MNSLLRLIQFTVESLHKTNSHLIGDLIWAIEPGENGVPDLRIFPSQKCACALNREFSFLRIAGLLQRSIPVIDELALIEPKGATGEPKVGSAVQEHLEVLELGLWMPTLHPVLQDHEVGVCDRESGDSSCEKQRNLALVNYEIVVGFENLRVLEESGVRGQDHRMVVVVTYCCWRSMQTIPRISVA